jgi:hypothetical protein
VLDTINWEVNPTVGPNSCNTPYYCSFINPVFADNEQGSGYPGLYPSPPYGGGSNGTGYSFGSTPNTGSDTLGLGLTNHFDTMPTYPQANMLDGTFVPVAGGSGLALTWDTFTTGGTYNSTGSSGACPDPPSGPSLHSSCWTPGPLSAQAISGLGFDIQLNDPGQALGPWSVTFAVYGATPGCGTGGGFTTVTVGINEGVLDCYDYVNSEMTDSQGDDADNLGCPDGDPTCLGYTAGAQLLGTITVNSDSNGDPAFFGFTTTDTYGIGALVETGSTNPNGDLSDSNFAISEQTLLYSQQTETGTPEPATLLLFGSGLLIAARRLRKRTTK